MKKKTVLWIVETFMVAVGLSAQWVILTTGGQDLSFLPLTILFSLMLWGGVGAFMFMMFWAIKL